MRWPTAVAAWWREKRHPKPLGYRGERAAEKFLKRLGYEIVARQLRLRAGELDVIAFDGQTLVFVEVKTRRSHRFGHPAEAVDLKKQKRITRAALAFIKRNGLLEYRCRFDVIAVTWPVNAKKPNIEHIKNAFEAQGFEGMFS